MSSTLLPSYHSGRTSLRGAPRSRSPIKNQETLLIMALLAMFVIAWFGLLLYVPETHSIGKSSFQNAYSGFHHQRLPLSSNDGESNPATTEVTHIPQSSQEQQPLHSNSKETTPSSNTFKSETIKVILPSDEPIANSNHNNNNNGGQQSTPFKSPDSNLVKEDAPINNNNNNKGGNDDLAEIENDKRRLKVREMIKHAWDGYTKFAMGENEVKPVTMRGHSPAVFGNTRLGATIVDSLDTLYVAGLMDEFNVARDWVRDHFKINEVSSFVSFFEFNIRFIGGFLSAYALSGETVFKDKAIELATKLMPAFNTPTGISKSLVNLKTGELKNWGWASGKCSVLSEIGTLQLEYQYLSVLSKNPIFLDKVLHIRNKIQKMDKVNNLYPNFINPTTGRWGSRHVSLGALGDSFYEYLLKAWLITSKKDHTAHDMFYEAIDAIEGNLFKYVLNRKFLLVSDMRNGRLDGKMQHLTCFSGGLFALASIHAKNGKSQHYMDIARNITRTCHESYIKTAAKLGPEGFRMDGNGKLTSRNNEKFYLLRPETVESYFYLWRLTGDPMYREWGWEVVQALEANCKVSTGGYAGMKDVYSPSIPKDDVQQTFFIAETLKYLYLLYSDNSVLSLDKWVFNTEAHPLPYLSDFPVDELRLNRTLVLT